ncbi:hypothetical protein MtrunA17_Chr3g0080531 [Medicago truncatula]|uniref:Uncharacterized protein n=1 Tax=Medicago truncatula TaxID=3880 RepID=A0A396IL73_MEDTR|nr:hypothetical protein MtrunA17_Chr3g0080531 [Medicago truncatula]
MLLTLISAALYLSRVHPILRLEEATSPMVLLPSSSSSSPSNYFYLS